MTQRCVLIVEADILARHPLAEYLRECGYSVVEASNADEARLLLASHSTVIDVVLADIDAVGAGGLALAAWIRAAPGQVELILAGTIARAAATAGDLCQDGPALSKPYDHRLVLDRIRRLLAARERDRQTD